MQVILSANHPIRLKKCITTNNICSKKCIDIKIFIPKSASSRTTFARKSVTLRQNKIITLCLEEK